MSDLLELELEGWGSDEPAPPPCYMAAINELARRNRKSQRTLAQVRVRLEPFWHVPVPSDDSGSFAHNTAQTESVQHQE